MPEHTDFLTRDELAAAAGVCRRTLECWAARGVGPQPIRHGPKLIRYRRDQVQAWLAEGNTPGWPAAEARDGPRSGLTVRLSPQT